MKKLLPIQVELRSHASSEKASLYSRFFKTGPGQYGEGDVFLGLTVPTTRSCVKKHIRSMKLSDSTTLLESPYHEERLAGVLSLVHFSTHHTYSTREVAECYLKNVQHINNWDLVDVSSGYIIGPYLSEVLTPIEKDTFVKEYITSPNIWKVRIVLLASLYFIMRRDATLTLELVGQTMNHKHDLIHKASGWMLREVGKRVSQSQLLSFLDEHAHHMPRTMLRYSIEHLTPTMRTHYMKMSETAQTRLNQTTKPSKASDVRSG
jgi:3-methyladenine DNA glycosylase AlkD